MKNVFIVCTYERDGMKWATPWKTSQTNNLLAIIEHCADKVKTLNVFDTWKEAQAVAKHWNNCFKENGTYMY